MSRYSKVFAGNPMLSESKRFLRRYLGFRRGPVHIAALVIAALMYLLLIGMIFAIPDVPPNVVVIVQLCLYCFILPTMLQGSIAGEREKGTWETLLSAPVSKAQIVFGKFWNGMLVVLLIAVLMLPPLLLWILKQPNYDALASSRINYYGPSVAPQSGLPPNTVYRLILSELTTITFGILLAAWCVFVSSRSKRSFSAQGAIFASLILSLIIWPLFVGIVSDKSIEISRLFLFLHPFVIVEEFLAERSSDYQGFLQPQMLLGGWLPSLAYLVLTVLFLTWAEYTLRFSESEFRFSTRGKRAQN